MQEILSHVSFLVLIIQKVEALELAQNSREIKEFMQKWNDLIFKTPDVFEVCKVFNWKGND